MTVIQRIQRLCDARDMSISALEKKLGFANKSLYERKGVPVNIRSDRLLAIAQFFNVSTDWLLTGDESAAQFVLSDEEKNVIQLYRALNGTGKHLIDQDFITYTDAGFVKKTADTDK